MKDFEVGQRVLIKGDCDDCTDHLDGRLGTIVEVRENDCLVEVDGSLNFFGGWLIWKVNLTHV